MSVHEGVQKSTLSLQMPPHLSMNVHEGVQKSEETMCCRQARQELKALKATEAIFQEDAYSETLNGFNGSPEGLL